MIQPWLVKEKLFHLAEVAVLKTLLLACDGFQRYKDFKFILQCQFLCFLLGRDKN